MGSSSGGVPRRTAVLVFLAGGPTELLLSVHGSSNGQDRDQNNKENSLEIYSDYWSMAVFVALTVRKLKLWLIADGI